MTGTSEKISKREDRAREAIMPIIEKNGLKLWDVCFEKEGAMWYLRILVDKEGGIDSDECEDISRPINEVIDKQDFIGSVDILEVGSPGLTKKLRRPEHFRACVGEPVRITKRGEKGKEYSVYGKLAAYNEETGVLTLEDENGKTDIAVSDCVKINSDL